MTSLNTHAIYTQLRARISIADDYADLQKRAANKLFNAVTLFQDFADNQSRYWADRMGLNKKMKTVVDQWRVVFKKCREDSISMVNDGFKNMEKYLDELSHQKKESKPKESAE